MSKNAKRQLKKALDEREPAVRTPRPPKDMTVEQRLRSIITGLLGGPRGDPDAHHMLGAAKAVLLLEQNGTPYGDGDTVDELSGKNIHGLDFMALAREDAAL